MLCRSIHGGLGVHARRSCTASLSGPSLVVRREVVSRRQRIELCTHIVVYASAEAAPVEADAAEPQPDNSSSGSSSSSSSNVNRLPAKGDNVLYAVNLAKIGKEVVDPDASEFEAHVKQCAGVQEAFIVAKPVKSGAKRHVGYIIFDSAENAETAREILNNSIFNGRKMVVKTAVERPVKSHPQPVGSSSSSSVNRVPATGDNVLYAIQLATGGVDPDASEFKAHVKQCAGVQDAFIVTNIVPSGTKRHVGYIIFDSENNAQTARETLNMSIFNGQKIKVKTHRRDPQPPVEKPEKPRKKETRVKGPYTQATYVSISNLAWRTADEDLQELFKGCEGFEDAFITYHRDGRPSGYGLAKFTTAEAAAAAVKAMAGTMLNNRELALRQMKEAGADLSSGTKTANYVAVYGLAWRTMDEDLQEHFKDCEGLEDAFITYNKEGRPSGVGYVRFKTPEAAAAAVKALQASKLDDRELRLRQMRPARAERAPTADNETTDAAMTGASDTSTRIVVKNIPPRFSYSEVLGMCSVFGMVRRAQILDAARNKRSLTAATAEASNKEDDAVDGGEKKDAKQQQKLIPAAMVYFADRESAEKAVAGLNGLTVQGSQLRANIYRGKREKGRAAAATAGQGSESAVAAGQGSESAAAAGQGSESAATAGQGSESAVTAGKGSESAVDALAEDSSEGEGQAEKA